MFLMGLSIIGRTVEACKVHKSGKLISRAKVQAGLSQRLISWKFNALWMQGYLHINVQNLGFFKIPANQLMNACGIPIKCLNFFSDNQDPQGTGWLEWICIIKGDVVHWLTDVDWVSQQWLSAHWRGWETECLSGLEVGVPQPTQSGTEGLKDFWRIPGPQPMPEATETTVWYNGGLQLKER